MGASATTPRTYEGGSTSPRARHWTTQDLSATRAVLNDAATMRARARQLTRNNPWAASALKTWVANCVGTGIKPRPRTSDNDLRIAISALWHRWTGEADADGMLDFYGLQALVAREQLEAGEIIVRKKLRRKSDGLSVPLQLQIIEADHLPFNLTRPAADGNVIRAGIEFDRIGQRVAYHLHRDHPGDASLTFRGNQTVRVPAENVLHVFEPLRAGQIRGVTGFAPALVSLIEIDQYNDAEIVRKKTAAMFSLFIETPSPDLDSFSLGDPASASDSKQIGDEEGERRLDVVPGMIQLLDPGEKVNTSQPADVGGSYEIFIKTQLRAIATGLGVTYEQMSGDLSDVNFSSIRAGLIEFRRRCLMYQTQILNVQFNQRVWDEWFRQAVLSSALDIGRRDIADPEVSGVRWIGQGFEYVNPVQDQQAHLSAVRSGFKTRAQVVMEMGGDPAEVEEALAAENERADELGLVLDSDPRKVAKSGGAQPIDLSMAFQKEEA